MLSPQEIKQKAEKWWNDGSFLSSWLKNESFFPKEIHQIGLVKPSETLSNFEKIFKEQNALKSHSKAEKGIGYELTWQKINSQKIGSNDFITKISFETTNDFLEFIDKYDDFEKFKECNQLIIYQLPELSAWVLANPLKVIQNANKWEDLLKVCSYFLKNPKPNLYIRQLPIKNLHTKFIEDNEPIVASLLNFILPNEAINDKTIDFEKRFGLLEAEPLIRFRFLDNTLYINDLSDISLPLNQFQTLFNQDKIEHIFIVENQMCVLTFPNLPNSICIFGSGQAVSNLSKISWIQHKQVCYWGDLDVEGFGILSKLRQFILQPTVLMMNWECFNNFSEDCLCQGTNSVKNIPPNLLEEEIELFNHLKSLPIERCRFEQERIPQWYFEKCLNNLLSSQKP